MSAQLRLFVTPWTVAHQAALSVGFARQEYWSGFPSSSPGHLPDPEIEPRTSTMQADALPSEPPGKPQASLRDPEISGNVDSDSVDFAGWGEKNGRP